MSITINQINKVIKELYLNVKISEQTEIISKAIKKFCIGGKYEYPLWDHLIDKNSYYDPLGWKLIEGYKQEQKKILFIEPDEARIAFEFPFSFAMPAIEL